mgnify:CR=1 FL=1
MGGYPSDYYVMPEHKVILSEDRKQVWIIQPLPLVNKNDLNVEVHQRGFCVDFNPMKKKPVHKCIPFSYEVDINSATAKFEEGVLTIMANIVKSREGKQVSLD